MKNNTNERYTCPFNGQWWRKIIVALEQVFCTTLLWLVCYMSTYIAYVNYNINSIFKYPIYFQVYFSWFLCLFIPVLFLCSHGKNQQIVKYCFLVVGILCVLSGGAIFVTYALFPIVPMYRDMANLTISSFSYLLPFVLLPNMGVGYILRSWCVKHYHIASYFIMLTANERRGYIILACYLLWWCIYFYVFQLFAV